MSKKPEPSKDRRYTVRFKNEQATLHDLAFAQAVAKGEKFGPWIAQFVCDQLSSSSHAGADSSTQVDLIADLRKDIQQLAQLILDHGPEQAAQSVSQLTSAINRMEQTQAEVLKQLQQFEAAVKHSVSTILSQPKLDKATAREYVNKVFR